MGRQWLKLTPMNRRRLDNFRRNRRGAWSLRIFLVLFAASLCAEFIANDRPLIAAYKGELLFPVFVDYPEDKFGAFPESQGNFFEQRRRQVVGARHAGVGQNPWSIPVGVGRGSHGHLRVLEVLVQIPRPSHL